MQAFEITDVLAEQAKSGGRYLEFVREHSLSMGVYALAAGDTDPQSPHREDEVYYVISGRAHVTVEGEQRAITPGSTIFVAAEAEHRFHDIIEDLQLLVFFAPPESS